MTDDSIWKFAACVLGLGPFILAAVLTFEGLGVGWSTQPSVGRPVPFTSLAEFSLP